MTGTPGDELRFVAERTAAQVRDALIHHAEVMSTPGVRYSAVADADDRVIDALNLYREPAERITGLSVLLRVPITSVTLNEEHEIPNEIEEAPNSPAEEVILEARWHFDVTDPSLAVAAAREALTVRRSAEETGESESDEIITRDFQHALAALFERDVPWPPPEYAQIGLIITEMDVAVYAQNSKE